MVQIKRHNMKKFSEIAAFYGGNPPQTWGFPSQSSSYFEDELENAAVEFLTECDSDCKYESGKLPLFEEIINSNLTQE